MPTRIGAPDLRVRRDRLRQGEEPQRPFEVDRRRIDARRQRGALRLVALLDRLAELKELAEAAIAQGHGKAGLRILAEKPDPRRALVAEALRLSPARRHQLTGVAAFGVVRAADEGAELAELERQLAVAAVRAGARVGAVGFRREDVRREEIVEGVEDLGRAQVLGLADRGREVAPEIAQDLFPVDLAVGDAVELLFEVGREVVGDELLEEALQEGDDEEPLVLGDEALLLQPDIFALAQHGEDRGVGRGPADAELLHALDEARLGVARRRLGEMLAGLDAPPLERIAGAHRRQAALVVVALLGRVGSSRSSR